MNFYDYKKFESLLVKSKINLDLWPLYKFILFNFERKKVIKRESKNINYFYLIIIFLWSLFLFVFYVFRSHIFTPFSGIVFGASTRLNREGDWLLGKEVLVNKVSFYHVSDFNLEMLKKVVVNRVVAINLLVEIFIKITSIKDRKRRKNLTNDESQLIHIVSELFIEQALEKDTNLKEALFIEATKFKLAKTVYCQFINLIKMDAKTAIVISAYSKTHIVAALHQLSFYVSEYQHGLIAPFHPISGVDFSIKSSLLVDDYYLSSTFWMNAFRPYDNSPLHQFTPFHYRGDSKSISITKPYIIFTSQDENYDVLIKFIEDFLIVFSELVFLYRPHPRGDLPEIKKRFSANPNFVYADTGFEKSTRTLISHSVAHVSMYSACHFDAFELKGKSYFLKPLNGLLFPDCVFETELKGLACIINDAYELKVNLGSIINE